MAVDALPATLATGTPVVAWVCQVEGALPGITPAANRPTVDIATGLDLVAYRLTA